MFWSHKTDKGKRPRVLALASAGGHWEQLMLLQPAFADVDVHFASTLKGLENAQVPRVHLLSDCNRNAKFKVLKTSVSATLLLLRVRPHVVITTGALPGLIVLAFAKWMGARTIWVDSIANAEEMSMAGRRAQRYSDLWLSQWPQVASSVGADYAGSIL